MHTGFWRTLMALAEQQRKYKRSITRGCYEQMRMKAGTLEDPWKCVMNDCSDIFSFPENSSRLINSQEEQKTCLCSPGLSFPSSFWLTTIPFLDKERGREEDKEKERERWPSVSFFYIITLIFLFLYNLSWRRAIHHDGGEQQQNLNSETWRWFICSLCSTFSLLYFTLFNGSAEGKNEKNNKERKKGWLVFM